MRPAVLGLALGATLSLASLPGGANPVPADEQSRQHGSDLYVLHCAECHGWAPMQRYGERFNEGGIIEEFDFSDLVEQEYGSAEEEEDKTVYLDDEEPWPEWAEFPDPGQQANDPDERLLIMEEMTKAIDDYYGTGEEEQEIEVAANEEELVIADPLAEPAYINDRTPGATDLLKPESFLYGYGEYDLFKSIAEGDGVLMPGFRDKLDSEESIWDIVNFLRGLWPQAYTEDY